MRDLRQEVTDDLVKMLEQGVAPWQKPWEGLAMPMNPTTGKQYRGGNSIHLMARSLQRGYGDPRWMTYRQAAEHGWQVRMGEKGTQIEFWEVKPASEKDSEQEQETDRPNRLVHRVYTVFNAHQIDGVPAYEPKRPIAFEAVQSGERILENSGARIFHDQADRAFYNRASDTIHLPSKSAFKDAPAFYGTALHELAHWSGHPSRLDRPTLNESYRFGDTNYAKEELRAELASLFLAAERGIPHDPAQHAAYAASWVNTLKEDKNEIFRAAHDASKAADFLLALDRDRDLTKGAIEWQQPGTGRNAAVVLVNLAGTVPARTDSGVYRGIIVGESGGHILQQQTTQIIVAHTRALLDRQPSTGENVAINYTAGRATVRESWVRARTNGLGR